MENLKLFFWGLVYTERIHAVRPVINGSNLHQRFLFSLKKTLKRYFLLNFHIEQIREYVLKCQMLHYLLTYKFMVACVFITHLK